MATPNMAPYKEMLTAISSWSWEKIQREIKNTANMNRGGARPSESRREEKDKDEKYLTSLTIMHCGVVYYIKVPILKTKTKRIACTLLCRFRIIRRFISLYLLCEFLLFFVSFFRVQKQSLERQRRRGKSIPNEAPGEEPWPAASSTIDLLHNALKLLVLTSLLKK